MKRYTLKVKHIILHLIALITVIFVPAMFGDVYVWSKDKDIAGTMILPLRSDYNKIKSKCIERAARWVDNLSVDPLELDKRGMKGKKHFVEKLFTFYQLYLHTTDSEKKEMYGKIIKKMCEVTKNNDYHLIGDNEEHFKVAVVSYVHCCYLMEKLGLNAYEYKIHIRKFLPRIIGHMPKRNASVQMMLAYFLKGLGCETGYTIEKVFKNTLIYNLEKLGTINILDFKHNSYMLGVCHEVFVFTGYGEKKIDLLTKERKDYLQDTLESSIRQILSSEDLRYLDLLAEVLISLKYLGCESMLEYQKGINFIMKHQNKNGSFGDYESYRAYFAQQGVDINIKWYLHTTEVCLWALLAGDD